MPIRSEDEEDQHKFPKFKILECGDEVRFELGMKFTTKSLVKDVVKSYMRWRERKDLHFKKNDRKK